MAGHCSWLRGYSYEEDAQRGSDEIREMFLAAVNGCSGGPSGSRKAK